MSTQDKLTILFIIVTFLGPLIGAVIGAVIGARAARGLLQAQLREARQERKTLEALNARKALRALQVEMDLNVANRLGQKASGIHVPFQREAMVAAMPYLNTLPGDVYAAIQEADRVVSVYNAVVAHYNAIVGAGRPSGAYTTSLDLTEVLNETEREAGSVLSRASRTLDHHLNSS